MFVGDPLHARRSTTLGRIPRGWSLSSPPDLAGHGLGDLSGGVFHAVGQAFGAVAHAITRVTAPIPIIGTIGQVVAAPFQIVATPGRALMNVLRTVPSTLVQTGAAAGGGFAFGGPVGALTAAVLTGAASVASAADTTTRITTAQATSDLIKQVTEAGVGGLVTGGLTRLASAAEVAKPTAADFNLLDKAASAPTPAEVSTLTFTPVAPEEAAVLQRAGAAAAAPALEVPSAAPAAAAAAPTAVAEAPAVAAPESLLTKAIGAVKTAPTTIQEFLGLKTATAPEALMLGTRATAGAEAAGVDETLLNASHEISNGALDATLKGENATAPANALINNLRQGAAAGDPVAKQDLANLQARFNVLKSQDPTLQDPLARPITNVLDSRSGKNIEQLLRAADSEVQVDPITGESSGGGVASREVQDITQKGAAHSFFKPNLSDVRNNANLETTFENLQAHGQLGKLASYLRQLRGAGLPLGIGGVGGVLGGGALGAGAGLLPFLLSGRSSGGATVVESQTQPVPEEIPVPVPGPGQEVPVPVPVPVPEGVRAPSAAQQYVSGGQPVYNAQGQVIGTTGSNGLVYDANGQAIGYTKDGVAYNANGQPIGTAPSAAAASTSTLTDWLPLVLVGGALYFLVEKSGKKPAPATKKPHAKKKRRR